MIFSGIAQKGIHKTVHDTIKGLLLLVNDMIILINQHPLHPHHGTHLHHVDLPFATLGNIVEHGIILTAIPAAPEQQVHHELTIQHAFPSYSVFPLFYQFQNVVEQRPDADNLFDAVLAEDSRFLGCQSCLASVADGLTGTKEIEVGMAESMIQL